MKVCSLVCISCTLRSQLHEIYTMIRTFPHGSENNHACKWTCKIFQECLHMYYSWKIVRKPFACMGILQSMLTGFSCMKFRGQICPILLRRKRNFPHGFENNHASKLILDNFPEILHMSALWKIVRNPVACKVVLPSMWKGPYHCCNFMESRSESAT